MEHKCLCYWRKVALTGNDKGTQGGGWINVTRAERRHNYKEIVIYPLGKPVCLLPALQTPILVA